MTSAVISEFVKMQYDNIVASPEDKRLYKAMELKNGMKILLISDPVTDKSAASLDVNIGYMHDPRELPGLAHFCEHMLFMGTEKYTEENGFEKFLSSHGGYSNASTGCDFTNYYFDVAPEYLCEAINRFSDLFISPLLFSVDAIEREVNAVDSEHNDNVKNDSSRIDQLECSLSDPAHDFNKFGTGNRKTLLEDAKAKNLDTREELLKFHQKHYSSNLMGLVVLGKESLDELTTLIAPLFSAVKNKNLPVPIWNTHPFRSEQVGYRVNVVPVKDLRSMRVYFPIPDLHPYYKSSPDHYVAHLLGHEGAGSVLTNLKSRGWANSLGAGPKTPARGFGFFSIIMDLSEDGLTHIDDILVLIFKYIKMLNDNGPQEWIHREVEDLCKMGFRFQDKQSPLSCVTSLSTLLHFYPIDNILRAPYMMPDYKPELIVDLLKMLSPENCVFLVESKFFENKTDKTEQWYGVNYNLEKFDPNLLERCHSGQVTGACEYKLPVKNDFIPTRFELYPRDVKNNKQPPELVFHDCMVRLWYKQDDEFLLPKCCVSLVMINPVVYSDPLNWSLASMFTYMLQDALTEYVYNAQLSGLAYSMDPGRYGIFLSINGYNEKQKVFLEKIVETIVTFEPDPKRFEILKECYVRSLKNFAMDQPSEHGMYYSSLLLSQRLWSTEEVLQEAESLRLTQVNDFVLRFFSNLHLEAFIHGNIDRNDSKQLVDTVLEIVKRFNNVKPLFSSQLAKNREVQLPEGTFHYFAAENKIHPNSALVVIFQTTLENPKENMLNQLLIQILDEPFYDQLRTKEQLGYTVYSELYYSYGTYGIRFVIQGEKSPEFVDSRLEEFLTQMEKSIEDMSLEEFEKHKDSLAAKRLEKPKNLSTLAYKYWIEIYSEQYFFNRDNVEVETMKKFAKDDVLKFFQKMISRGSAHRKKLSVYVYSSDAKKLMDADSNVKIDKGWKISDILSFKSELALYPLAKPYLKNIPSAGICEVKSML